MTLNQMPPDVRERLLENTRRVNDYVADKLQAAGVCVVGIDDIANSNKSFPDAVPVLMELLDDPRLNSNSIYLGVIHALRDPAAIGVAFEPIVKQFKLLFTEEPSLAAQIAVTVGYVAQNEHAEELLELLRDKSYGQARGGLVDGLRNLDSERLIEECRWMLQDPELANYTLDLIRKRKLTELIEEVRAVREGIGQAKPYTRAKALKTLNALSRVAKRGQ